MKIIEENDGNPGLYFKKQVLSRKGVTDEIRTACHKANSTYQSILSLERSIAELHQMFLELVLLTEIQGEQLEKIQLHISDANQQTDDGNEKMVDNINLQKKIHKKQGWIILIVLIVIGIVILLIWL
jgi:t-SNARE complex subunit (syntaxin)